MSDHLGNIRLTFNTDTLVLQEDSYYPFGMTQNGLSFSERYQTNNDSQNKFLFGGKVVAKRRSRFCGKKDSFTGHYEFGFRNYDAQLARWHVRDPLAENYSTQSPYHFAGNNPINNFEINGAEDMISPGDWQNGINNTAFIEGLMEGNEGGGSKMNLIGEVTVTATRLEPGKRVRYGLHDYSYMTDAEGNIIERRGGPTGSSVLDGSYGTTVYQASDDEDDGGDGGDKDGKKSEYPKPKSYNGIFDYLSQAFYSMFFKKEEIKDKEFTTSKYDARPPDMVKMEIGVNIYFFRGGISGVIDFRAKNAYIYGLTEVSTDKDFGEVEGSIAAGWYLVDKNRVFTRSDIGGADIKVGGQMTYVGGFVEIPLESLTITRKRMSATAPEMIFIGVSGHSNPEVSVKSNVQVSF
ncbi:MAG: hypothetical protein JXR51_10370 [Bacteroidales bacterium]|nr:hypothetical protein [Bacteroidales bacterium]